jgi:hypothetical protein
MKTLLLKILLLGLITNQSWAGGKAGYFRVWQGFQRPDISPTQFITELPRLMKATPQVYPGETLSNYIVVIPPKNSPAFIPHELALVALSSENTYKKIRSTPAGQAYGDLHWEMFDKNISKSAPFAIYDDVRTKRLMSGVSYDMIGEAIDWSLGYTTVFIGLRKPNLPTAEYLLHLQSHVELAKQVMAPQGLRGYIFIANENYEVAYLNWTSKQAHDAAGTSDGGKKVFADAGEFMDVLMYQEPTQYRGQPVDFNKVYSAKSSSVR